MSSPSIRPLALAMLLLAALAGTPAIAQTSVPVPVKDYDVFVDLPTAFAFIKLPTGWKFIGKLDADQLRHLPAGTLTALLMPGEPEMQVADDVQARAKPPRM